MPPVFKAIVSIIVWVLFIYGFLGVIGGVTVCFMGASGGQVSAVAAVIHPAIGVASLILAAVAAWLRKALG